MINAFNNKYPYTDFHELNLDWLLENYQEIVDHVAELQTWMRTHKVEYAEAMVRLTAVENEINTFEASVNREFAALKTSLEAEFAALKKEVAKELANTQAQIMKDFERELAKFASDFQQLEQSVRSDITSMQIEIKQLLVYMQNIAGVINDNVIAYVDDRLDQFIRDLPDYENLIIYNPVRGIQTNVQTAINDLYGYFAVFGLTATQYDSLQLTAEEYDNYGLTAREYDVWGYKRLGYPDPDNYMRDPFTGKIVLNTIVIYELADLHKEALTAWEYDHLGLTAEEYDTMELSAYFYDWYGIRLWDSAITAEEYDNLELTAWDYDSRMYTAIQYDNYAKVLLTA